MSMSDTFGPHDRDEDYPGRDDTGHGDRDEPFETTEEHLAPPEDEPVAEHEPVAEDAAGPYRSDELELTEEEERLPWLEGDDDDIDEGGYATGQLVMLALLGIAALALIFGGIWWATRDKGEPGLVAEGGVIEAPDTPYKEKPENPGGKTFEGTGDTSFAVSEGETRPARLGQDDASPKPGFDTLDKGAQKKAAAEKAPPAEKSAAPAAASGSDDAASAPSGPGVQVGAFSTRALAESGWSKLSAQNEVLSGMRYRIVEGRADIGTVYRLQALPGDAAAARSLCSDLKAAGLSCQVKN
ncbi:hypothetical protein GCM10011371_11010 [Novosphingobium marinum]|nr:SPOR domain-containing protein [Novosphingobium marinum]GGC25195.1 hypothetical protein GCM10011371_11010 [Novosphingobium marinum]